MRGLYSEDEGKVLRKSHDNPFIKAIYEEYLEYPNSHVSHELLHTHYVKRGKFNQFLDESYVKEEVKPMAKRSVSDNEQPREKGQGQKAVHRVQDDLESVRVLALEAENARLKQELSDSEETVDILKQVVEDYVRKSGKKAK
jgi:NADH-quinone oxidoreductase subunit G/NADP-reducing hydrogenase subunit HndD